MTRLGISCAVSPHETVNRMARLARRAEEGGIEALWILDSQTLYQEAYVTLAVLAQETQRILLGPGVTNLITRNLTVVAAGISTLARLSDGRVIAGIGTGDSSVRPLGLKPMKIAELKRGIRQLRQLLSGQQIEDNDGEGYSISTLPEGPVSMYVAGTQQRMLETCGAVGDGVIIVGPADASSVEEQLSWIESGARSFGRDPSEVQRDLWVGLSIGKGRQPVDDMRSYAATQGRMLAGRRSMPASLAPFRSDMLRAAEAYDYRQHLRIKAPHGHYVGDEFTKRVAIAGDMEECRDRLAELLALALDRISITLLPGGRERRLEELLELWSEVSSGS